MARAASQSQGQHRRPPVPRDVSQEEEEEEEVFPRARDRARERPDPFLQELARTVHQRSPFSPDNHQAPQTPSRAYDEELQQPPQGRAYRGKPAQSQPRAYRDKPQPQEGPYLRKPLPESAAQLYGRDGVRLPVHSSKSSRQKGHQPDAGTGQLAEEDDRARMAPSGDADAHYKKKKREPAPRGNDSAENEEAVEMRGPRWSEEEPSRSQAKRTHHKYQKGPSSDSVPRRFSSQPGARASAYSSLSIKSWSEVSTEMSVVKQDLNKHFKPIFDQHGPEGMQVKKLREELESRRSQHLLGRESILDALRTADHDGDDYLSYADFVQMITGDLKSERKLAFRGMMLSAISNVGILPKEERDNFLANYQLCPPPLFIPVITLIQIIFFAVYVADLEKRGVAVTANGGYPSYSPFHYVPRKRWQVWRFLTYMFIHNGYLHIVFNVVAQVLFGFPLELVHGWWRTTIIYLTGVTAGSLAHSVVDSNIGLVGASGGVYAILGAHLAAVVTNWVEMNYKTCDQEEFQSKTCCAVSRLLVSAPARMVIVVLLVFPDTALAIVRRAAFDEDLKVGVTAHVGGFLTGLLLGIPVLKNVNKHAWEGYLGIVSVVVFLLVCAFAIFFNALYRDRYPETDWNLP